MTDVTAHAPGRWNVANRPTWQVPDSQAAQSTPNDDATCRLGRL